LTSVRVLLVDDDVRFASALETALRQRGYVVVRAPTAADALRGAPEEAVDIVLLDLVLPDKDGIEVCRELRRRGDLPIIAVTARGEERERVLGLRSGADDYVVKPFGMAELMARVKVTLRRLRRASTGESRVTAGPLTIDLAARAVMLNGTRLVLTPKEYRLLQVLAQHAGNVVTHGVLMHEIWGQRHLDNLHYLRILVRKLRRKIERDPQQPRLLMSEHGVGYRLSGETAPGARE